MAKRALYFLGMMGAVFGMLLATGCGVKQNNAKSTLSDGHMVNGYGPYYSSSQGSGTMTTPACAPNAHHPCARVRASVGMPYQYDANSNKTQGIVQAGGSFPSANAAAGGFGAGSIGAGNTYTTTGGAGKTKATAYQPNNRGDLTYVENRDLKLMQNQASPGEHRF